MRRGEGNGDICPQDATHGRMFFFAATRHQHCPHSAHKGVSIYEENGVTPFTFAQVQAAQGRKGAHV